MADLLSGLSSLGLGKLAGMEVYEENKPQEQTETKAAAPQVEEKDIIYDRNFECAVCGEKITAKTVKAGKCRIIRNDLDLRAVYEGIDVVKYDVIVCPHCGYAALTRYHKPMPAGQIKLIKENISANFKMQMKNSETLDYEDAFQRYQLALANAIVKKARASEKAYICLKSAWLLRGWGESLTNSAEDTKKKEQLAAQEKDFLKNAFEGFVAAVQGETFPMCGMDEVTVDYLMSVLAMKLERFEIASKLVGKILTSPSANPRMKDKTRDLKELILEEMKKRK